MSISSFDLSTTKIQSLFSKVSKDPFLRVVYDPVTQLLVWKEEYRIYTFSLNSASSNEAGDGNLVVTTSDNYCNDVAVDSCGGYIYWMSDDEIERARLDGSDREVIIDRTVYYRPSLAIDQQAQRIYWIELNADHQMSIYSANFNGRNRKTLYIVRHVSCASSLAISKNFIYWQNYTEAGTWQLPKNSSEHVARKLNSISSLRLCKYKLVAVNYTIQEPIQEMKSCGALQGLMTNNSKPESTVTICQNYCLEGDCSVNAAGKPTCRCKTVYSGKRCEVNTCQSYCLNGGVCSVNEQDQPACRCSKEYEGSRCEFPAYLIKCVQAVSMLKDVLSADIPPVTLSTAEQSTCASTVV
ncbi:hypothetical protein PYW07_012789 [Mythimna separata]|uniref:Protein cueball n=1 Tax=Mythimna separata TaxID=271217 RepID=A0AAD7Y907_MYTSE|nr:hypothetical protein PYW07_012789 [Mythimna separata]